MAATLLLRAIEPTGSSASPTTGSDASLRLRPGDTDVLDLYDDHGRLRGGTRRQMSQGLLDAR